MSEHPPMQAKSVGGTAAVSHPAKAGPKTAATADSIEGTQSTTSKEVVRNGVPLLPPLPGARKVTMDIVNALRDGE